MDQIQELLNYRYFLENHKNVTEFNFTGADEILQEFEDSLLTVNQFSTVVLLTLYIPIFIIGLFGNLLIIVSISADKAKKSNLYFLVNLAFGDLVVTVLCMPTSIGTTVYRLWVYGRFLCKFTAFIQGVAVAVSIFSMTAMSIDRYVALQYPATSNKISTSNQAFLLILFMWIVSCIFMGPLIFIRDIDIVNDVPFLPPLPFCVENWPDDRDRKAYGVFLLFVVFIIPGFTIGVCYGHVGRTLFESEKNQRINSDGSTQRLVSRKRAARLVIILICVFMVCWLPYNVISALADLSDSARMAEMLPYVLWFGHAHSAVNPMMYWSLNKRFRYNVHRLFKVVKISGCTTSTNTAIAQYV